MRVLAVVVTYFPNQDLLERNIDAFLKEVDKVIIWENTPVKKRNQYRFIDNPKVEYAGDGANSISRGLNYAWNYAQQNAYDYLLTMDQDSVFLDFDNYLKTTIDNNKAHLGITGPAIVNSVDSFGEAVISECGIDNHLITSGMLVPIILLENVNGYNDKFDIEAIDIDLCIRVKERGYKIYKNGNGRLLQVFGKPSEHYLFGKKYVCPNYGPGRLYEIFKNHVILYRRYKLLSLKALVKGYLRNYIPRIILWEEHKLEKICAIFLGIKDGVFYKIQKK